MIRALCRSMTALVPINYSATLSLPTRAVRSRKASDCAFNNSLTSLVSSRRSFTSFLMPLVKNHSIKPIKNNDPPAMLTAWESLAPWSFDVSAKTRPPHRQSANQVSIRCRRFNAALRETISDDCIR